MMTGLSCWKAFFSVGRRSSGLFDAVADGVEAFGHFYEVRVGEVDVLVMAILHILFPFDQAIAAVVEDEGDEVRAQAVSRFKFLNVHQETGVAGDGQDFLIGMDEFGRKWHRGRQCPWWRNRWR